MRSIESRQGAGQGVIDEWLAEGHAMGPCDRWAGEHRHPRFAWTAALDVYVQTEGRRSRAVCAAARDVSRSGLGFFCRQPLPVYGRVTICRSGERTGLAAKIVNRAQTLGGYLIGVEFIVENSTGVAAVGVA
jgi:hypothetical protein